MKKCTNCNAILKEGVKFCTNCGAPVKVKDKQFKVNAIDSEMANNSSIFSKKTFKIVAGFIGVIALFFILNTLMTNTDVTRKSSSVSEELLKVEGKWYDPTGVLLGDQHAIINIKKSGDRVFGQDDNNIIKFQLSPTGSNKFEGSVIYHGVEGDFVVSYIKDEKELIFTNKITKSSWKIKKF